jgi:hypothetical protein
VWAAAYETYDALTHDELRNIVHGFDPQSPIPPGLGRAETADEFVRQEIMRVAADRRILDAILTGVLPTLPEVSEQALKGIKDPKQYAALRHAVAHVGVCAKRYRYPRAAALRWAASQPAVFPNCPFTMANLPTEAPLEAVDARTRTSLLVIIASIAKIAGLNLGDPKAPTEIAEAARDLGVQIDPRTITNHLKGLPEALERREHRRR